MPLSSQPIRASIMSVTNFKVSSISSNFYIQGQVLYANNANASEALESKEFKQVYSYLENLLEEAMYQPDVVIDINKELSKFDLNKLQLEGLKMLFLA